MNPSSGDDRGRIVPNLQNDCWRHFIDRALFDSSYSLRVASSFRYLCGSDSQFFTLRDFADKGKLVIPYLCINLSYLETNFAIMDIFRRFDKNASGKVFIDDFVIGIISCINQCNTDDSFLKHILQEMMPNGSCTANALLMQVLAEFPSNSAQGGLGFHQYFSAITYLVKENVDNYLAREKEAIVSGSNGTIMPWDVDPMTLVVDEAAMSKVLKNSIEGAIAELQEEFHTPWYRIKAAMADHGDTLCDEYALGRRASAKPTWIVRSQGNRMELGPSQSSTSLAVGSPGTAGGKMLNATAARRKSVHGGIAGFQDVAMNSNVNKKGKQDGDTVNEVITEKLGKQQRPSPRDMNSFDDDMSDLDSAAPPKVFPRAGGNQTQTLNDISFAGIDMDDGMIFLVQTAFRSLGNLFSLLSSSKSGGTNAQLMSLLQQMQQQTLLSIQHQRHASGLLESDAFHLALEQAGNGSGNGVGVNSSSAREVTDFESELARNLVVFQDKLLRTQLRLDVVELVQLSDGLNGGGADMITDGYFGDDKDPNAVDAATGQGNGGSTGTTGSKALHEPLSFENIMAELGGLKAAIAERATTDLALGKLLESECAMIPLLNQNRVSLAETLNQLEESSRSLNEVYKRKLAEEERQGALSFKLAMQEEHIAELNCIKEQQQHERNQLVANSIELQILRDKVFRLQTDLDAGKGHVQRANELQRRVADLEEKLSEATRKLESAHSQQSVDDDEERENAKLALAGQLEEVLQERERLSKENNRLNNALKINELRVKNSLQDQMNLQQQLHLVEDELISTKAHLEGMRQEIEAERMWKDQHIEQTKKIHELQRELLKREGEIREAKADKASAKQHRQELSAAESVIETLENKMNELSLEAEKGLVAQEQLESYRQQLRLSTKENHELKLQNKSKDIELKDFKTVKAKQIELLEELQEYKIKMEKLPILLAEVARLRGSSRAAVKALTEQDKIIGDLKARVKKLEREATRLQGDNRSLMDVEHKLKEANAEIAKLMTMVAEVTTLRAGVKNAEEEKLAMEGQYKKMRKFVRNSVLVTGKDAPAVDQTAATVLSALTVDTSGSSPAPAVSTPSAATPLPPPPPPNFLSTPRPTVSSKSVEMGADDAENKSANMSTSGDGGGVNNTGGAGGGGVPAAESKETSAKVATPRVKDSSNESAGGDGGGGGGMNALLAAIVNRSKLKKAESD